MEMTIQEIEEGIIQYCLDGKVSQHDRDIVLSRLGLIQKDLKNFDSFDEYVQTVISSNELRDKYLKDCIQSAENLRSGAISEIEALKKMIKKDMEQK